MGKLRMISMVFVCMLSASIALPVSASVGDNYSAHQKGITLSHEHATHAGQQSRGPVSDEVLLIGAAVIGLIGISIMRKTLH